MIIQYLQGGRSEKCRTIRSFHKRLLQLSSRKQKAPAIWGFLTSQFNGSYLRRYQTVWCRLGLRFMSLLAHNFDESGHARPDPTLF